MKSDAELNAEAIAAGKELDPAVWRLDNNNGVLELDEILFLQLEDLLAHLLGLLLGREGNENQVAHRCSLSVLIVRPVSPLLASRSLRRCLRVFSRGSSCRLQHASTLLQ